MSESLNEMWDRVAALPEELQTIWNFCWDDTGRPKVDDTYSVAVGRIMDLCEDWDGFMVKHKLMFPEFDYSPHSTNYLMMSMAWASYVKGMLRVEKYLANRS